MMSMTKVQELLERRAEGWESDEEEAGEGLYYTDKQLRVFRAIVENREANIKEVAGKAGVHPSYVRYIINRLPQEKAVDMDWMKEKAGLEDETEDEAEDVEEEEVTEVEVQAEGPPEKTALEKQVGTDALMESFGVQSMDDAKEVDGEDGVEVKMVRSLPVTISVTIPGEFLSGEDENVLLDPDEASP